MKKTAALLLPLALTAGAGLAAGTGLRLYRRVLARHPGHEVEERFQDRQWVERKCRAAGIDPLPRQWKRAHPPVRESLCALDGTALSACRYPAAGESRRWAIVLHGYRSCCDGVLPYAALYHQWGMHVLAPDLRGHGKSGGDYCAMGGRDSLDLLQWIDWILQRDPGAEILLHGCSMGAAAVILAASGTLPEQVKCAVADSGFACAYDAVCHVLLRRGLPAAAAACMDAVCWRKTGFSLQEIAPKQALHSCRLPMLFIHGEEDHTVPLAVSAALVQAHPGEKEYFPVPGAGHIGALYAAPQAYADRVQAFAARYMGAPA